MREGIDRKLIFEGKLPVWLRGEDEFVFSSKVVLHRNLKGYKFPRCSSKSEQEEVCHKVLNAAMSLPGSDKLSYSFIEDMIPMDRGLMFERGMCDTLLSGFDRKQAVIVSDNGEVTIHVNAFDHIEITVNKPGMEIEKAIRSASLVAKKLGLEYAEMDPFGYLTTIPALMGTGMDVRILIHLPSITFDKEHHNWTTYATSEGILVSGFFGFESAAFGAMYSLRNQNTHKQTEEGVAKTFRNILDPIIDVERVLRSETNLTKQKDTIARAYGTLRYVCQISFSEAMSGLSLVRLGINLGLLTSVTLKDLSRLVCDIFPTHLQANHRCLPEDVDTVRASVIRKALSPKSNCE